MAAAAGAAGLAGCSKRINPSSPPPPGYVAFFFLHGGYDSLLTFDPRFPAGAHRDVQLEYRADEILAGRQRHYGPLFKAMMPHEDKLALLHGVRVDTAGHDEGTAFVMRGRARAAADNSIAGDRIGPLLPGDAPIAHLMVGDNPEPFLCNGDPSEPCEDTHAGVRSRAARLPASLLSKVGEPPAELTSVMEGIAAERAGRAAHVFSSGYQREAYRAMNGNAAALSVLLASATTHDGFSATPFGRSANAALEAIRNNTARFITVVSSPLILDSHRDNLWSQRTQLVPMLEDISAFLRLLATIRNAHGPLIDQTTIMIGTEMGRYHRINLFQGRDHWPENTWAFAGRGIRTTPGGVTVGSTDALRRGNAIDFDTGESIEGKGRPVSVESAFATLVRAAGLDPTAAGYAPQDVIKPLLG
jgi:Protein of unknown function (DUF1501)